MILTIIAAADEDNVIGLGNTLPWNLPADMRHFRERTKGHPVIMGRKTYESILERRGTPLQGRRNIVISQRGSLYAQEIDQVASIQDAIDLAKNIVDEPSTLSEKGKEGMAFVIGGQQVYELAMPFADKIDLTRIHAHVEGDRFFPPISLSEWGVVSEERHEADQENQYAYSFLMYERKK